MGGTMNRRQFIRCGVAASVAGAAARSAARQAPAVRPARPAPRVVASANGHLFRNGGPQTCVEKAFDLLAGGADVLDAVIAGVNIVELDPLEDAVGYGGLPNADGVVQLDSCCMHGPTKRAGGVAALEGVRTPSRVAQAVMRQTDHHLLAGAGAREFARLLGFTIEEDLNSEHSRRLWLEWKRRSDPLHDLDPAARRQALQRVDAEMAAEGRLRSPHRHGTIHCNGLSPRGELAAVTTTSGLAWKIPGRVGDSPILGAGLYVDGEVGAAGSTGRGEANLFALSSFFIVEELRRGRAPKDAGLAALKRVVANTVETRLLNSRGRPNFDLVFYVQNARGEHAGVTLYGRQKFSAASQWATQYAVCDENGARFLDCEPLFVGEPAE